MAVREYIGARYIPIFSDPIEWDNSNSYEPLTVVTYQGSSYVSRQYVPQGITLDNTDYWILWADFNAQIEAYREEVQTFDGRITTNANDIDAIESVIPKSSFTSTNTVKKYVDDSITALGDVIPKSSFTSTNTVKKYVDDKVAAINDEVNELIEEIETTLPYSVVSTYADMYDTEDDIVLVINDNSYYGSNETVMFTKAPNDVAGVEPRANGDKMVPIARTDDSSCVPNAPMCEIGKTIASYIGVTTLEYGTQETALSPDCTNEIDCGVFAQMVLWDIPYNKSRYVTQIPNSVGACVGNNYPINIAGRVSTERPYGYRASELAMFFAQKNRLFYIDHNTNNKKRTQLQPGDIVFESDYNGEITAEAPERYQYISHTAVVVETFPNTNIVLIAQGGAAHTGNIETFDSKQSGSTVCKLTLIDVSSQNWNVFARPDYGYSYEKQPFDDMIATGVDFGEKQIITQQSSNQLGTIRFTKNLEPQTFYTLVIEGDLPNYDRDGCWFNLYLTGSNYSKTIFQFKNVSLTGNKAVLYCTIPNGIGAVQRAILVANSTDLIDETTFNIKKLGFYEGYISNPEANFELIDDSLITLNQDATLVNNLSYIRNGIVSIKLKFKLANALSAGDTICTLNEEICPYMTDTKYFTFYKGANSYIGFVGNQTSRRIATNANMSVDATTSYYIDVSLI